MGLTAVLSCLLSAATTLAQAEHETDVAILSDTHFTSQTASRALQSMSCWSDQHLSGTAIRPPMLDFWAATVLDHVLAQIKTRLQSAHPPSDVILHLGDAGSIGCESELLRFAKHMRAQRGERWFMAPGNHDAYLMGNIAYLPELQHTDGNPRIWRGACTMVPPPIAVADGLVPDEPMDKDRFLCLYLHEKGLLQTSCDNPEVVNHQTLDYPYRSVGDGELERALLARYPLPNDTRKTGRFLLQQIKLSNDVSAILIDTIDYFGNPYHLFDVRNQHAADFAGNIGAVGDQQLEVLAKWVAEIGAQQRHVVVLGHYPLLELRVDDQAKLEAVLAAAPVVGYVSGHAHLPAMFCTHAHAGRPVVELNVGSVLDWPMEYGYLRIRDYQSGRQSLAFDKQTLQKDLGTSCGESHASDYVNYCSSDRDSKLTSARRYYAVLAAALSQWATASQQRLVSANLPPLTLAWRGFDAAIATLRAVVRAQASGAAFDEHYALCEAMHASAAEDAANRHRSFLGSDPALCGRNEPRRDIKTDEGDAFLTVP